MPKSGRITSYPIEYFDLFNRVVQGEELKFAFASEKEAMKVRFDMYGFRNALQKDTAADESSMQLALFADSIEFLIEENTLIVRSRDKAENLQVIKTVLEKSSV